MGRKLSKPKREMGRQTGYTRFPDGSIQLCPMYTDSLDQAMAEESAVHAMLETVTRIAQERLTAAQQSRAKFWKTIAEDVGIDLNERWVYERGRLFRRPLEEKE